MPETDSKLLLTAGEAAATLSISRSLFYGLHSSGQIGPLPIRLGGRVLWRADELRACVTAGCLSRARWLQEGQR